MAIPNIATFDHGTDEPTVSFRGCSLRRPGPACKSLQQKTAPLIMRPTYRLKVGRDIYFLESSRGTWGGWKRVLRLIRSFLPWLLSPSKSCQQWNCGVCHGMSPRGNRSTHTHTACVTVLQIKTIVNLERCHADQMDQRPLRSFKYPSTISTSNSQHLQLEGVLFR